MFSPIEAGIILVLALGLFAPVLLPRVGRRVGRLVAETRLAPRRYREARD